MYNAIKYTYKLVYGIYNAACSLVLGYIKMQIYYLKYSNTSGYMCIHITYFSMIHETQLFLISQHL